MYQFKDNKSGVYYHEQKFTLQWNFPNARWVILRYVNGNRRVILPIVTDSSKQVVDGSKYKFLNSILWFFRKKTRKHRYKRLFVRKPVDEFTNIANYRYQHITLYSINSSFPWIKSERVQMHVKLLRLEENKLNVEIPQAQFSSFGFSLNTPNAQIAVPDMLVNDMNVEVKLSNVNPSFDTNILTPEIRKSINQLIASGEITEGSTNESILQLIK
jgi:hypothetical protein